MKTVLEGFDFQNERNNSYAEINQNLIKNRELIQCNNKNDILCTTIEKNLKKQEQVLNDSRILRNEKQISFNECNLKQSTCQSLYDNMQSKITEFKDVFNDINDMEEQIKKCNTKQNNCQQIENLAEKIRKKQEKLERGKRGYKRFGRFLSKKFSILIEKNKLQLIKLENEKNQCFRELEEQCSQEKDDFLINKKRLQTNIHQNIENLNSAYQLEDCNTITSCDNLLKDANLAASEFKLHDTEYKIIQNDLETCKDPYKNQCKDIFIDLEKNTEKINDDIVYMKHKLENMANLAGNVQKNNELSNLQTKNTTMKANFKLYEDPNVDNCKTYESEVCKNIVLTTITSVLLYYFFFEI